jgi:hypothetical protein
MAAFQKKWNFFENFRRVQITSPEKRLRSHVRTGGKGVSDVSEGVRREESEQRNDKSSGHQQKSVTFPAWT